MHYRWLCVLPLFIFSVLQPNVGILLKSSLEVENSLPDNLGFKDGPSKFSIEYDEVMTTTGSDVKMYVKLCKEKIIQCWYFKVL